MEDVQVITLPEQKVIPEWDLPFPLILAPGETLKSRSLPEWFQWLSDNFSSLREELIRHGAIYFRGFPLDSPADFDEFVKRFSYEPFPYVGGAATRRVIVGNVFTSNEAPSDATIPYHHEMAQVPDNPDVLFFYCDVTPGSGGETPIVLSHVAKQLISQRAPEFVGRLEREGVRYIRVAPDGDDPTSAIGRGWQSTFGGVTDRETAEERAAAQGTIIEWLDDGSAKTITKVLPAITVYQSLDTWFNSIIAAYIGWNDSRNDGKKAVVFGGMGGLEGQDTVKIVGGVEVKSAEEIQKKLNDFDIEDDSVGDPMPEDAMEIVLKTMDELAVSIKWQRGDVMMIDNRQVLHARRPFTPPRTILACLCRNTRGVSE